MKTRQAVLVEPGRFEIRQADVQVPPAGFLVKMQGCGLCTWELNHWGGRLGKCPMPLGHEGWGVVVEVGKETTGRIKPGDRITGLCSSPCFADYFTVPERHAMKIADPKAEVPGEPLYCVQNVLRAAHPEIGDTVAVVGCGPMGLWAVMGLACPQLKHLIAIDIDPAKLDLARSFGATHVIDPAKAKPADQIKALNDGFLCDVVVEGTGGGAGIQTAIDILQPRRRKLVVMSSFKGKIDIDIVQLCAKAIEVQHAHPGIARDLEDGCRRTEVLINKGVFRTEGLISHRFPVEKVTEAFRSMEDRPKGYLKGAVVP